MRRRRSNSKGVYDAWRLRAFAMAAMRRIRNGNGMRKSWRQIGERFGVDPVNAYKSVKLHNGRVGKDPDGNRLECQDEKRSPENNRLPRFGYGPIVRPSETSEGLGP